MALLRELARLANYEVLAWVEANLEHGPQPPPPVF